ncbi:MAG: anthranilate synthase component I [Alphaproteobacteria bacterium]|nr:anthranilate synthase component I [Alphaproteobacteria bacterium]MBF0250904.1 anthranilate synthase component I [Alphaproteobacteria bacterium]
MDLNPGLSEFEAAYAQGRAQVVWTTLAADLDTPVSAYLKLVGQDNLGFLLESVEGGANRGRYSFVGCRPDVIWRATGETAEINRDAIVDPDAFTPCPVAEAEGTLKSLRALMAESRIAMPAELPPMAAGLIGYLSYDSVRLVETIPDDNPDVLNVPDGMFLRPTVIAIFDNAKDIVYVVTPVYPAPDRTAEQAFDAAQDRLARTVADFENALPPQPAHDEVLDLPEPQSNMTQSAFHDMVKKAQEYILAGDIFQVVLSQRFKLPFSLPPFAFYRSLRRINPSPFLFFLNFGGFQVAGSSPEILVRLRDGTVTIRPIAGTRPRGQTPDEDKALEADLLADPKERAEHLMLLDLGRNDVGRVAQVGTVTVTGSYIIERYSHVMHIVSNVEGKIAPGKDAIDALYAGFPAGTVSGAPKVRAMEIIDELEPEKRGIYAGCIGYFGADGEMDTCIALRTAVIKDGWLYAQAGGGVVADSTPEGEYQESRNKAKALIRAAEEAVRFARRNA